eukprot:TRINITY_DN1347_c0_g1_i3.p2 TRINITY_DN1347_c0_g1~~TRINITY_DN1347_c0_g1_i3.p2  ORF type:complete len:126 (-),score=0.35 TRINITY_DN1347_c0_g1_i3:69-446(-)
MNEIREFDWVSDEENGSVISSHIPISFFSIEFNSEASRISCSIWSSFFSSNSRKSSEDRSHFSNRLENFSLGIFSNIMSDFKISMISVAFSMHNSFWYPFPVEMGKFINQVKIRNHNWPIFASSL